MVTRVNVGVTQVSVGVSVRVSVHTASRCDSDPASLCCGMSLSNPPPGVANGGRLDLRGQTHGDEFGGEVFPIRPFSLGDLGELVVVLVNQR
jgi:hypothetical protein